MFPSEKTPHPLPEPPPLPFPFCQLIALPCLEGDHGDFFSPLWRFGMGLPQRNSPRRHRASVMHSAVPRRDLSLTFGGPSNLRRGHSLTRPQSCPLNPYVASPLKDFPPLDPTHPSLAVRQSEVEGPLAAAPPVQIGYLIFPGGNVNVKTH